MSSAGEKIIERIKRRLNKHNKNRFCIITGEIGSGKSYSALSLAEKIDPELSIDKVVFTVEEFMNLNSGKLKRAL